MRAPYARRVEGSRAELQQGATLGPYRLEAVLGEGTMGVVYRAVREPDGEVVALKVLKAALGEDETYRRRFEHEARAAQEVRHRHLVPVLDAGEAEGRAYLVVAYVSGRSLDALHARGLVHRDMKPANIMLSDDGAVLTDFGLAKGTGYTVLTRAGQVVGTMDYLAPELIRGSPATPATDIYALGCVVFECLVGSPPFGDRSLFEVGAAHLEEEPADPREHRPGIPAPVSSVVLQALRKEPGERSPTATMYAHLLRAAAASSSQLPG